MARFFVDPHQIKKDTVTITGSDVNHIKNVLRLKTGDEITILDGTGKECATKITLISKDKIQTEIISYRSAKSEAKVKVTIAQGIPKGDKMDFIIQKCTELGVSKIIPVITERTVVKLDLKKAAEKVARWQKIAKEASEQSGRLIVTSIGTVTRVAEVVSTSAKANLNLILWEIEKEKSLKEVLKANKNIKSILVLVGPEGGFSNGEVDQAMKAGFTPVSLGKRILRSETAPLAALSMINYEFEL